MASREKTKTEYNEFVSELINKHNFEVRTMRMRVNGSIPVIVTTTYIDRPGFTEDDYINFIKETYKTEAKKYTIPKKPPTSIFAFDKAFETAEAIAIKKYEGANIKYIKNIVKKYPNVEVEGETFEGFGNLPSLSGRCSEHYAVSGLKLLFNPKQ